MVLVLVYITLALPVRHPSLNEFLAVVLGVAVVRAALGRRRVRIVRGKQSRVEKGTVAGSAGRTEAEESTNNTMMELLRLKVSGDSPEHRVGGEMRQRSSFVSLEYS